jgi:hypothetical protein
VHSRSSAPRPRKAPTLPIIFVGGYADMPALDRIGNATILRKPIGPDRYLVRSMIRHKPTSRLTANSVEPAPLVSSLDAGDSHREPMERSFYRSSRRGNCSTRLRFERPVWRLERPYPPQAMNDCKGRQRVCGKADLPFDHVDGRGQRRASALFR